MSSEKATSTPALDHFNAAPIGQINDAMISEQTRAISSLDHPENDADAERGAVDYAFPKFDDMRTGKIALILTSLGMTTFVFAIEETIVATSVAGIGNVLNVKGSLTWITMSYLLTTTVFQPITGRIADAVGTKRLLILELWIFIIGNVIAGASKTLTQLVAGRLISGVGGAGLLSLSTILISQLTHERQRGSYLNLINVVFIIADAIGPLVGGAFYKSGNWRWIFLLSVPFGPVITIILMKALHLPPSPSQNSSVRVTLAKMDVMGMTMLVSTLTFLVIGLNLGGQAFAWNSPTIIGMFCAAGVSFIAFVVAENYATLPVAPMNLFVEWQWRNVPIIVVTRCLLFFHLFATIFYVPIYLQVIGVSVTSSGALVIPFLTMSAISSTLTNYVASKYGHVRPLFMLGLAILPIGMGLMSTLDEASSIGRIVGYCLISGFGFGSGTQISIIIAQVGLPPDALATVTALVSTAPNLGGVLGVGIIGTIINNAFRRNVSRSLPHSLTSTLNLNDVVTSLHELPVSVGADARTAIVRAYIRAWQLGCWVLAGIAAAQFLICLILRPVEMRGAEGMEGGVEEKEARVEAEKEIRS